MNTLFNRLLTLLGKYLTIDAFYVARGGFWLLFEQLINNGTSFVLAIIFARVLSQETYGTYNYVHSLLGILALLALPGMNTAVNQATARGFEKALIPAFNEKVKWSVLGSIAALSISAVYFYQQHQELAGIFVVIAFFFPLMYSSIVYDAYLQGKKDFKLAAIFESIYQLANTIALITVILLTQNLVVIFLVFALVLVVLRFLFYRLSLHLLPPNNNLDANTVPYGRHLSVLNILGTIAAYLDRLLIYYFLGPVELAIYSFAILPIDKASNVFDNIPALAMPKLSGKTLGQIEVNVNRRLAQLTLLGVMLMVFYVLIAPLVFRIFFPTYLSSVTISQLFSLILIVKLPALFLSALGQAKVTLYPKTIMYLGTIMPQALYILLLFILGKIFGLYGILASKILFYVIASVIAYWAWKRLLQLYPKSKV